MRSPSRIPSRTRTRTRTKSVAALGAALSAAGALTLALAPSAAAASNGWELCVDSNLQHCNYWTADNPPRSNDLLKLDTSSSGVENLQDRISSISIHNASTLYTWNDNNYTGIQGEFQNNYTWNTLNYPYNDSISSIRTW